MPELPFTAMTSTTSGVTSSSPSTSFARTEHTVVGRPVIRSYTSHTNQSELPNGLSLSPRESPIMSSLTLRRMLKHAPTESESLGGVSEDDINHQIGSLAPELHPVSKLEDIIESGRAFSNLTDPASIKRVCLAKIPGWRGRLTEGRVHVSQIMAGLTNQLFRVEVDEACRDIVDPGCVLFRVYGSTVGDLYDPAFELQVFKVLSQNDSAPKLIADFPGGRIEEYILGPALLMQDMCKPPVFCAVATILGRFHKLDHSVPEIASWRRPEASCWRSLRRWSMKAWNLYELARITSKDGEDLTTFEIDRQTSIESIASTEDLVRDKAKRMDICARRTFMDRMEATGIIEMMEEARILHDFVLSDAPKTPILDIGFCHNDVQENNILVAGTRLRLIDFEYADFNHLAYDIANFLCETTMDYCISEFPYFDHNIRAEAYPSEELVRMFGSVYLTEYTGETVLPSNNEFLKPFINVTSRFILVSHLLWGFWSLIRAPQAATTCDFDFLLYAKSRFEAYRQWKKVMVKNGLVTGLGSLEP